jgi:chromosome segregation ATPase
MSFTLQSIPVASYDTLTPDHSSYTLSDTGSTYQSMPGTPASVDDTSLSAMIDALDAKARAVHEELIQRAVAQDERDAGLDNRAAELDNRAAELNEQSIALEEDRTQLVEDRYELEADQADFDKRVEDHAILEYNLEQQSAELEARIQDNATPRAHHVETLLPLREAIDSLHANIKDTLESHRAEVIDNSQSILEFRETVTKDAENHGRYRDDVRENINTLTQLVYGLSGTVNKLSQDRNKDFDRLLLVVQSQVPGKHFSFFPLFMV